MRSLDYAACTLCSKSGSNLKCYRDECTEMMHESCASLARIRVYFSSMSLNRAIGDQIIQARHFFICGNHPEFDSKIVEINTFVDMNLNEVKLGDQMNIVRADNLPIDILELLSEVSGLILFNPADNESNILNIRV